MKIVIFLCLGMLLGYYEVALIPFVAIMLLATAALSLMFPSNASKKRKEDFDWAMTDPQGHWEATKKKS